MPRSLRSATVDSPMPEDEKPKSDVELFEAVRRRDQNAYREVFQRYAAEVLALCFHILRDRGEAEDVTAEVFLELWNNISLFGPGKTYILDDFMNEIPLFI